MTKRDLMLQVLRDAGSPLMLREIMQRMGDNAPKSEGALRTLLFRTRKKMEAEFAAADPAQTTLPGALRERLVSLGWRYALVKV